MDLPEKLTTVAATVAAVVGLAGAIQGALYLKDGLKKGRRSD